MKTDPPAILIYFLCYFFNVFFSFQTPSLKKRGFHLDLTDCIYIYFLCHENAGDPIPVQIV